MGGQSRGHKAIRGASSVGLGPEAAPAPRASPSRDSVGRRTGAHSRLVPTCRRSGGLARTRRPSSPIDPRVERPSVQPSRATGECTERRSAAPAVRLDPVHLSNVGAAVVASVASAMLVPFASGPRGHPFGRHAGETISEFVGCQFKPRPSPRPCRPCRSCRCGSGRSQARQDREAPPPLPLGVGMPQRCTLLGIDRSHLQDVQPVGGLHAIIDHRAAIAVDQLAVTLRVRPRFLVSFALRLSRNSRRDHETVMSS
jgi:hypothetical protein